MAGRKKKPRRMKKSARQPRQSPQPTAPDSEAAGGPPPDFDRRSMDKVMADLSRLLSEREFESIDEANTFMEELMSSGGVPSFEPATPLEKAQELMYNAFEARGRQRVRLARQALEVCADCADAYVLLADEAAKTDREALDLYRQGVAAGERALGSDFFDESEGLFWGLVETRPYMRARYGLAQLLWATGDQGGAIEHAQEMLRLNPNDIQGVRYGLMLWLLETDRDEDMSALLEMYPDDGSTYGLYPQVLFVFRQHGDGPGSRAVLQLALQANPHVPEYLLGRREPTSLTSPYVTLGSEEEAADHALAASHLWRHTPGALEWLATRVGD